MRASLSCEKVPFTQINALLQWDFMQTAFFPKADSQSHAERPKRQGIQTLILCLLLPFARS